MSGLHFAMTGVATVLLVAIVIGLFWRGRQRQAWPFIVYLVSVFTSITLIMLWPERFYQIWFWSLKEGVYGALKLVIAVHLANSAFRVFPGAHATARRLIACLLPI